MNGDHQDPIPVESKCDHPVPVVNRNGSGGLMDAMQVLEERPVVFWGCGKEIIKA